MAFVLICRWQNSLISALLRVTWLLGPQRLTDKTWECVAKFTLAAFKHINAAQASCKGQTMTTGSTNRANSRSKPVRGRSIIIGCGWAGGGRGLMCIAEYNLFGFSWPTEPETRSFFPDPPSSSSSRSTTSPHNEDSPLLDFLRHSHVCHGCAWSIYLKV